MNVGARGVRSAAGFSAALLLSFCTPAAAGSWHVDRNSPACSNSGPGSAAVPYCTITAAANARGGAGNTLFVNPGRYREQVTVPASGLAGSPFVVQAAGPGVIVDGTDDVSSTLWLMHTADVRVAPSVTWLPKQVFVDGARLTASTLTVPADITPGTFLAQADGLYVNLGGDDPSDHLVEVGRRSYGFVATGRSWVTIDGFQVMRVENRGIALNAGSDDCVVSNNTVTLNRFQGIAVNGAARARVENNTVADNSDHGIYVLGGATGAIVRGNESYGNARPTVRAANGISLSAASNNTIENNRLHHNQDSGMQFNAGSHGNLSRQNISWNNGDHGFDHVASSNNVHIGDVAHGNFNDGFSQEGTSPGTRIANCIGVNNGLLTAGKNLWVDSSSTSGFVSDHNIFWNETGLGPIRYVSTTYQTIAAFTAATGHDSRSIQAAPLFQDAANGLFHLLPGSPAIDAADSSVAGWPAVDALGAPRLDDPLTQDTGSGPVAYGDRGALEHEPRDLSPPVAALTASPAAGTAPQVVALDASASFDPDGTIVSYRFDFGDGSPMAGPQAAPFASHAYGPGSFRATVTVADEEGLEDMVAAPISLDSRQGGSAAQVPSGRKMDVESSSGISHSPRAGAAGTATAPDISAPNQAPDAVIDLPAGPVTILEGQSVVFIGTASDADGNTPLSYRWTFGHAAPASTLKDPGPITFTRVGTYTITLTVTDARGLADPTPATLPVSVRKVPPGSSPRR